MKETLLRIQTPGSENITLCKNHWDGGSVYETLSIVSGIHGNHYNGIYIANRLTQFLDKVVEGKVEGFKLLGGVQIFPVINAQALQTGNRFWAFDGLDLNLAFPGNDTGECNEKICQTLLQQTNNSSCGIILDMGDIHYSDFPHAQTLNPDRKLKKLIGALNLGIARDFSNAGIPKTMLIRHWNDLGIPAVNLSFGKAETLDRRTCDQTVQGIINLMLTMDILTSDLGKTQKTEFTLFDSRHEKIVFAEQSGLFIPEVCVGESIKENQKIGEVCDVIDGRQLQKVLSPTNGFILTIRDHPLVYEREPLALLLTEKKTLKFWPF